VTALLERPPHRPAGGTLLLGAHHRTVFPQVKTSRESAPAMMQRGVKKSDALRLHLNLGIRRALWMKRAATLLRRSNKTGILPLSIRGGIPWFRESAASPRH
jgi:hypothetical protein